MDITDNLSTTLNDAQAIPSRRFRAALALAKYDADPDKWSDEVTTFLAAQLVQASAEHRPRLRVYLRQIGPLLLGPLETIYGNESASDVERVAAAESLADFAGDDAQRLARLITSATTAQYPILFDALNASWDDSAVSGLARLVGQQPESTEQPTPRDRVELGRRRAGAAITLLRRGERESIFDVFRVGDDPESLTQFVHGSRQRGVTVDQLLDCLDRADRLRQGKRDSARKAEDPVLYGVLLALGEFERSELAAESLDELIPRLVDWYANDPSSMIHGGTGWLLRHWRYNDEATNVDHSPTDCDPYDPQREWFVREIKLKTTDAPEESNTPKSLFFTFVVFPEGDYLIGSPPEEDDRISAMETQHAVTITRPFAMMDREIARAEFDRLLRFTDIDDISPTGDHAVVLPAWYHAVLFCRWLAEHADGLTEQDQCFPDPETLDLAKYSLDANAQRDLNLRVPRNWPIDREQRGFRLPTEAEWEIACRAGALSAYCFGNDVRFLDRYGWFLDNSSKQAQIPGRLRPNLRGVFDMHGNALEWCLDWAVAFGAADQVDPFGPNSGSSRVLRGGGWGGSASYCRSANRSSSDPASRSNDVGFRVSYSLFPSRP